MLDDDEEAIVSLDSYMTLSKPGIILPVLVLVSPPPPPPDAATGVLSEETGEPEGKE